MGFFSKLFGKKQDMEKQDMQDQPSMGNNKCSMCGTPISNEEKMCAQCKAKMNSDVSE